MGGGVVGGGVFFCERLCGSYPMQTRESSRRECLMVFVYISFRSFSVVFVLFLCCCFCVIFVVSWVQCYPSLDSLTQGWSEWQQRWRQRLRQPGTGGAGVVSCVTGELCGGTAASAGADAVGGAGCTAFCSVLLVAIALRLCVHGVACCVVRMKSLQSNEARDRIPSSHLLECAEKLLKREVVVARLHEGLVPEGVPGKEGVVW